MAAALDARFLSGAKTEREAAEALYAEVGVPPAGTGAAAAAAAPADKAQLVADVRAALYAAKVCSYAQGFNIIRNKDAEMGWGVDLGEMARIWKGGCIIRAAFLDRIKVSATYTHTAPRSSALTVLSLSHVPVFSHLPARVQAAYRRAPALPNLLADPDFARDLAARQAAWRRVVTLAIASGVGVPGMTASLGYFDTYRRARLPANLVQAQRDFFGSHTYERVDRPGSFHTVWDESFGSLDSITTSGYNA
jgi:6-phosphogluconate dehydrogenase